MRIFTMKFMKKHEGGLRGVLRLPRSAMLRAKGFFRTKWGVARFVGGLKIDSGTRVVGVLGCFGFEN